MADGLELNSPWAVKEYVIDTNRKIRVEISATVLGNAVLHAMYIFQ
jgi:hypothetical protein